MGCILGLPSELHLACEKGDLQTVLELTKEGAEFHEYSNLNRKDGEGRTALFVAAASGFTDIVRELIKLKDIDVNAQDDNGDTPQIIAGVNKHPDCVTLLLSAPGAYGRKKSGAQESLQAFAQVGFNH